MNQDTTTGVANDLTGKVKETTTRLEKDGDSVYDAVVLDAPPTGRIRPFLDVTKDVAGLAKMGPIHKQSQGVIEVLHAPSTWIHLVTLLEEMPVQETLDAAADRGAVTPLLDAGLTKDQVRAASRVWGLPTWDKPAAACLSSRVAYGVEITPARLARVERAEAAPRDVQF